MTDNCPCGIGENPCPGPDGQPLCADGARVNLSGTDLLLINDVRQISDELEAKRPSPARVADREALEFDYTNWEGKRGHRRAIPISIRYGITKWHPKPGFLMLAFDLDKNEEREFAMRDMEFDGDQAILSLLDNGGGTRTQGSEG